MIKQILEMIEGEIWKPVVGYSSSYEVSNMGRVRSKDMNLMRSNGRAYRRSGTILSPCVNSKGYHQVNLYSSGKKKVFVVHRLVAKSFIANYGDKPHVNHINSSRVDNRVDNLEWCTHSENMKHAKESGSFLNNGGKNIKVPHDDIVKIRKRFDVVADELAKQYGVTRGHIYDIRSGRVRDVK